MAKFRSIKNSFLGGQISPSAEGRTDLPQYASACRLLKNMIPLPAGGAYRRPGTLFDYKVDGATYGYPVLFPFVVSQSEPYAISIAPPITPGRAAWRAHRPANSTGTSTVSNITDNTLNGFSSNDLYTDSGDAIQYVQSVDVMTMVHPLQTPMRLRRTAVDTFKVSDFNTDSSGAYLGGTTLRDAYPYLQQNTTATTLTPSAVTGAGITITASAATFHTGHLGALFKINHAGTIGCAEITGFTSSTIVTATVIVNFGATTAQAAWWESAWSDYRGWPRAVGIYQRRMCYAGTALSRDSLWFSQSDNFDVMSVSTIVDPRTSPTDIQPFTIEIGSDRLNLIQWLSASKTLTLGTQGDEAIIEPEVAGTFGCDNAKVTFQSHFGSSHHMAVRVGSELIFALASGDEIRSLVFNLLENAYNSESVQVLFDNYPKPTAVTSLRSISRFKWDEGRRTLWCVDTAGNLYGLMRDRGLQVSCWHTHELGGTDAIVKSIAIVPNPGIGVNDIWLTVSRTIGGQTQYHIERFMGRGIAADTAFSAALGANGNYFTDATVFDQNGYPGPVGTVSEGDGGTYDHLVGETVVGVADSANGIVRMRDSIVVAGSPPTVTLVAPYPPDYDSIAWNIAFGLPFQSVVAPVRLEAGSQIGTAQGAIKRIHKLTMRFFKTLSAKFGPTLDDLETITFRSGDTPMNESPDLFTGDKTEDFSGDYDRDGYVYVVQDDPLPFAVVSIVAEGMTDD